MTTYDVVPDLDTRTYKQTIGLFATGVTVITCSVDGTDFGTTASAVSSVSAEPPMLLMCLNKGSETGRRIDAVGTFAVNVLSHHQDATAMGFATTGPDKFAGVSITRGALGSPLITGSIAHLECSVAERVNAGTHTIFVARVAIAHAHGGDPLAYFSGSFGRFVGTSR